MSRKSDALTKMLIAVGHGTSADYTATNTFDVLRELAVVLECAPDVQSVKASTTADVLNYIADNYGVETKEPYALSITADENVTLAVKVNGKVTTAGDDKLWNGDKVKVTATPAEGYVIASLTLNGEDIESGDVYVVDGEAVAIVATAEAEEAEVPEEENGEAEG